MTPADRAGSRRVIKNEVVPTISGNLFRPEPPAPAGLPAPAAAGLLGAAAVSPAPMPGAAAAAANWADPAPEDAPTVEFKAYSAHTLAADGRPAAGRRPGRRARPVRDAWPRCAPSPTP